MALPPPLDDEFLAALGNAFQNLPELDTFLMAALKKPLIDYVPGGLTRPDTLAKLAAALDSRGEVLRFAEGLRQDFAVSVPVQQFWRNLVAFTGAPTANPFDACLLHPGQVPIWGRRKLRTTAKDLFSARGKRILVVDGGPRTGRSHSWWFINHVAAFHGADVHWWDMAKRPGATPGDVGRLIGLACGWDLATLPGQHAQPNQWAEEVGEWVAARVRGAARTTVLIFDNSSAVGLAPETKELLTYLAGKAALVPKLRLVFLAHKDRLDPMAGPVAEFDTTAAPAKTDFYSFLDAYSKHNGYAVSPAALTWLTDRIWNPLVRASHVGLDELARGAQVAMKYLDRAAA